MTVRILAIDHDALSREALRTGRSVAAVVRTAIRHELRHGAPEAIGQVGTIEPVK